MNYRPLGKTGLRVSALGFGVMRLPTTPNKDIDEAQSSAMLHYAFEQGVNYFDTAYPYLNGQSESFVGRTLQGGMRQKVTLVTKMPAWFIKETADFDRYFNEQLARLQTDYLDVYLLHGLARARWQKLYNLGVLDWLEKAKADGRIRFVGFSFHDELPVFKDIVDAYDRWDVCQIQYNYMNETHQAGTEGLLYAAGKGLGVVIMEPLLGGRLVSAPPAVQAVWDSAEQRRTPAEWALQWLWNKPQVGTVLSGMGTMQQVEENIASASRSAAGSLSAAEQDVVKRAQEVYAELAPIPCTGCRYCMPCPNGVDIPRNMAALNMGLMYDMTGARRNYAWISEDQDPRVFASSCIQCQECEEKCPQFIPISQWMPYIHEVLGLGHDYDPAVPKSWK